MCQREYFQYVFPLFDRFFLKSIRNREEKLCYTTAICKPQFLITASSSNQRNTKEKLCIQPSVLLWAWLIGAKQLKLPNNTSRRLSSARSKAWSNKNHPFLQQILLNLPSPWRLSRFQKMCVISPSRNTHEQPWQLQASRSRSSSFPCWIYHRYKIRQPQIVLSSDTKSSCDYRVSPRYHTDRNVAGYYPPNRHDRRWIPFV